jgi:hypothetical protein
VLVNVGCFGPRNGDLQSYRELRFYEHVFVRVCLDAFGQLLEVLQ